MSDMADDILYAFLGKLTEDMYYGIAKEQTVLLQNQLVGYHSLAESKISELINIISKCRAGEIVSGQQKKIQIFRDDFSNMKDDINSKYKIYLRGCGNAGKSTLLNALLSLDENSGSRMSRIPTTFAIDIYTDELSASDAMIRFVRQDGTSEYQRVSRSQAVGTEAKEEKDFMDSVEKCRKLIKEKTRDVYLETRREDIENDIYRQYLLKTKIREIRWGIGENQFFHNCLLVDTPGLSQELRFTNVLEDVKNYEVDGIIWVISTESLNKQEVIDAYQQEFKEMRAIYEGKRVIAVINMYGTTSDYKYGSRLWKRVEKKAWQIYCENGGFDDIICVNAKMAYDGNLNNDKQLLEDSNILELRSKINEMFTERSAEALLSEKLEKIETFLDKLYMEIGRCMEELEYFVKQYEEKSHQIDVQSTTCKAMAENRRDAFVERYLADVKNRLNMNIEHITQLERNDCNDFINEQIVMPGTLNKELNNMFKECMKEIKERFKEQQIDSVVSSMHTREYAFEVFRVNNTTLGRKIQETDLNVRIGRDVFDDIGDWLGRFGDNFITNGLRGALRSVKDMIEPPQTRIYRNIENSINWSVKQVNLSDEVDKYVKICIKTLNGSMEQTCGSYKDVKKLIENMEKFINMRQHMEWEKVGLQEIMGGIAYV